MYVAPGLLDRRLRFYQRAENGADGFARPVYIFGVERWGRVDRISARQQVAFSPQAHVEIRADAVAMVADGVTVDSFGIVKDTLDDTVYFVRGVVPSRQLRVQVVSLEAIDPTAYATFELWEGDETLDGVHLVGPEA